MGTAANGFMGGPQSPLPPKPPSIVNNAYGAYNGAVGTQAGNYDDLMDSYRKVIGGLGGSGGGSFSSTGTTTKLQPYTPTTYNYKPTGDYQAANALLTGLAGNGGYTDQNIADLRARGTSPIRAAYANAQRNVDRQRALQGGYSPNYTAATAKMAREQGQSMSDAETNVNASIANQVAGNKLQAAGALGSLASHENDLSSGYGSHNNDILNDASKYNSQLPMYNADMEAKARQQLLDALAGARSLYGTRPGLVDQFGGDVTRFGDLTNNATQTNNRNTLDIIGRSLIPSGGYN